MDEKSKRITRSYYLTEEAVDKVKAFADHLDISASEVVEQMIRSSVVTGQTEAAPIEAQDRKWARAVTGGREPSQLVVYYLPLPEGVEAINEMWTSFLIQTDKGPVGVMAKFGGRQAKAD